MLETKITPVQFALRLFIDDKRALSHELTREQAVTFIHTAEHLIAYLRDTYQVDRERQEGMSNE